MIDISLFLLYLQKACRRLVPRFETREALPRLLYRAELDRLGEVALRRAPGESRESFAWRLRERLPAFEPLTSAHVAAVFGAHQPDPTGLRDQAAQVRRDLRGTFPAWRRFLGLITPWSWLRSK